MDRVVTDLTNQHSNLKNSFEKEEGPSQDKYNEELAILFKQYQAFVKSDRIQSAANKLCVDKIDTAIGDSHYNAENIISSCFVIRSKTLMSIVKEIRSVLQVSEIIL